MTVEEQTWGTLLGRIVDGAHLVTGDGFSVMVDELARSVGLDVELFLVDLPQRGLRPIGPDPATPIAVEGTVAGFAYQHSEVLAAIDRDGRQVLWVPMLDGTERVGVLRAGLGPAVADDAVLREGVWILAGLCGHIIMTKLVYSDRLRTLRNAGRLAPSAELLWQLLPPRTCATGHVVVSALAEPYDRAAGDAFDYALDDDSAFVAVFDGVGHDLRSGLTTALALTAVRNARRAGETDLAALAAHADDLVSRRAGPPSFVTAVLARLDVATGRLEYLLAGHPAPVLLRGGRVVKALDAPPRLPLGLVVPGSPEPTVGRERLEPGDRLLCYSDGIVEARDGAGEFFGEERLVDFTERADAAGLSVPETLRRLVVAVLEFQGGQLQDDATLLMVDWSAAAHRSMFPGS